MDPRSEPVRRRVLQVDRLGEGLGGHDAEHRSEVLGEVELAACGDPLANARSPQVLRLHLRLDQPGLALGERRQGREELALRRLDDRPHLGERILRDADTQGRDGIYQLALESLRLRDGADEDDE